MGDTFHKQLRLWNALLEGPYLLFNQVPHARAVVDGRVLAVHRHPSAGLDCPGDVHVGPVRERVVVRPVEVPEGRYRVIGHEEAGRVAVLPTRSVALTSTRNTPS